MRLTCSAGDSVHGNTTDVRMVVHKGCVELWRKYVLFCPRFFSEPEKRWNIKIGLPSFLYVIKLQCCKLVYY